jgi:mono/diheme cytochrome c family protein
MNYPVWELTSIGGGSLIALIAVLHVYISHLAVGGGLFIWLTDRKAYHDNNSEMHAYVKKHTWFFLLLTMVFGGMTGVGIWFIIALVNPAATSALIHNFVFGWAIEWVFFVGEITALLVYYYYFDKLSRKVRLNIAFLYFLFAWLSLVIINGILSFMLTPGGWIETHGFWDGFFNPTFLPSLVFRTFITMMIGGLFGYVTTVFLKESAFRTTMMRYCSKWLLWPLIGIIPSGLWYYYSLPEDIRNTNFTLNPQTAVFIQILIIATALIFLIGVFMSLKGGRKLQIAATFILLVTGLFWMGGFEYSREIARKPYIIRHYMYSNSLLKSDLEKVNEEGVLKFARWTSIKEVTPHNTADAGREIFNLECLSCHTVGGIRNDILPLTRNYTFLGMRSQLTGQGKVRTYMPPFAGTREELQALATYIVGTLHGKSLTSLPEPVDIGKTASVPAEYNPKTAKYVLLAWNDLGMHCMSDSDPWFVILPPGNTLEAQLIRRGEVPVLVTEGVKLTYQVEKGFEFPARHVPFWEFAEENFGFQPEANAGLYGNGVNGSFHFDKERGGYIAPGIPVVPYNDDGSYNPYPLFTVEATDTVTGEVLVRTQVVAPVSTGMGCRNCHGGGWRVGGISGLSDETAMHILEAHDRLSGTDLMAMAKAGKPMLCQTCHADPAMSAKGDSLRLNLSAAMHGWHANYMPVSGADACVLCHPAHPEGRTRCMRGIHNYIGVECVDCHGTLSDHALSLLKGEADKQSSRRLMANLNPEHVDSVESVNPRKPWLNEPDCLTCHVDFGPPEIVDAYNVWNEDMAELYRMRQDNAGIRCPACHGSTHALYPATNPMDKNRDVLQPLQYSEQPYPIGSNMRCEVCHIVKMKDPIHHENMYRMFRNMAEAD